MNAFEDALSRVRFGGLFSGGNSLMFPYSPRPRKSFFPTEKALATFSPRLK
jgi:hypothetical protein